MRSVDRAVFACAAEKPYADEAQPIGHNATLSAPHMHAVGLDILAAVIPQTEGRVLDVGAGSGYAVHHRRTLRLPHSHIDYFLSVM